jgi:type I restriction enzyme S subunit
MSCTVQYFIERNEAELKTGPFGTQLHASDYVERGTPVINVRNIGFGHIRGAELEFISNETVRRLSSHLLEPNDIVFGRKGAVERHAFIRERHSQWFQGSDCLRLRWKSPSVDPRFISYWLLTEEHKQWIMNQCSHGSTMASLNQAIISRIPLYLPPLPTQRRIAAVLSAYDDLIENNVRRIAILEEMARNLYREWFVDFRFPGHESVRMMDGVPEGWEAARLRKVAVINNESIKRGNEPEEINYVDIASVSPGRIDKIEHLKFNEAPGRARRIVRHGDTIWSTVRPNRRSYSLILNPLPDTIASTGFAVLTPKEVPYSYLYHTVTTDKFAGYLTTRARGSAYPAVSTDDFDDADIVLPPEALLRHFHDSVAEMHGICKVLDEKNTNLRRTRDLLLPKLVSGEIDVSELEIAGVE